ncbi:MAG: hypothetical protein F6K58_06295 [Symploca sp. SIO2E9]|nr:hypothetical protein [Symploca sp. SIO2E9]
MRDIDQGLNFGRLQGFPFHLGIEDTSPVMGEPFEASPRSSTKKELQEFRIKNCSIRSNDICGLESLPLQKRLQLGGIQSPHLTAQLNSWGAAGELLYSEVLLQAS